MRASIVSLSRSVNIVANVEPELIESIRSCAVAIEPDVSALGLAKLLTVSLGNQRTGEAEYLNIVAQCAVDKLCTSSHVAPLVVATKLKAYAIFLILI